MPGNCDPILENTIQSVSQFPDNFRFPFIECSAIFESTIVFSISLNIVKVNVMKKVEIYI